ncbi:MAG: flagellar biosynthetic protein FliO [Gammaproteobacteria bacterium]|uniref:flagellar biosynthetic protein FliO n=1 Tax=Shewanella TaxID=22 RepID=UPI000CA24884|nr:MULTISPECIES: flagellar biosynthetic protein FliO [Shewanella]EGT3628390.1 flagellar biosynthetic protein FliO [Morganella morganii]MBU1390992.1 flagellar biosynthetic protein FliO [Gammaproteobacteria bacterium]QYX63502.1 flagellar biosynthetic protein FliO [Shewanella putrefaciens]AUD61061.1 flagellar biosynthesis protein FliO [Shewanella sp. Pdp11]MBU1479160.1 flagellar biosynthetic protein FliO [Gammaproteobacteria bacterium]
MTISVILSLAAVSQAKTESLVGDSTQGVTAVTSSAAKMAEPSQVATLASMLGGLILVLLLIFALAYLLRRFNLVPTTNGVLKTIAVTSLGQKERLVLVQVGEQQYLLGVSSQQVSLIDKLVEPIHIESDSFASRLRQAKSKQ